ncbi:MAG: sorbosone dehydrogenase family protein [Burkholderiales bacterium]|nr:MAG: sorbosone dehydrogenase family protein [Burkholderiales bacterium]
MTFAKALQLAAATGVLAIAACSEPAQQPVSSAMGANPSLTEPDPALIPTLKIAEAVRWSDGQTPTAAQGLKVQAFATGLDHPRWLHVLPNGDVLVAETNAPERPEQGKGVRGLIQGEAMKKAGAVTKTANRISLLRDTDGDGVAETRHEFLTGLNSPFGMALAGGQLYVANTDAVVSVAYKDGDTKISAAPQTLTTLPGGPLNHHWTKALIASKDGSKLYATVGSNSNIAENGLDKEEGRAAIWEIDRATGEKRLFATGLRNPNGMGWEPTSGALWTAVNERDELGHNLVPDYITSVKDGGFYGWPWSYFGQTVDTRVKPENPEMVAKAIAPDYALGAHTASLGLTFAEGQKLGSEYASGAFIGQHGSWNRDPFSGYKVIFVPFTAGKPAGQTIDVLTGFIDAEKEVAFGRPVGVAVGRDGSLLVADDVGNAIWRVSAAASNGAAAPAR